MFKVDNKHLKKNIFSSSIIPFLLKRKDATLYSIAVLFLLLCAFFLSQEKIQLAEKVADWAYLFLSTGFCYTIVEN